MNRWRFIYPFFFRLTLHYFQFRAIKNTATGKIFVIRLSAYTEMLSFLFVCFLSNFSLAVYENSLCSTPFLHQHLESSVSLISTTTVYWYSIVILCVFLMTVSTFSFIYWPLVWNAQIVFPLFYEESFSYKFLHFLKSLFLTYFGCKPLLITDALHCHSLNVIFLWMWSLNFTNFWFKVSSFAVLRNLSLYQSHEEILCYLPEVQFYHLHLETGNALRSDFCVCDSNQVSLPPEWTSN